MKRSSKLDLAQKDLTKFLESTQKKIYTEHELVEILEENRSSWGLPKTTRATKLLTRFVERNIFKAVTFFIGDSKKTRYFYKEPTIYEIALSLKAKSYISHYPALLLNDLTNQIPKTIYVTHELSPKIRQPSNLNQDSIDLAFSQTQRRSGLATTYEDYKIVFLEGKFTNRSGVITNQNISYTNLERTLIDSTVRPNYSGGAFSVLEAYKNAVVKPMFSANKMIALLGKMDFIYPYHQAIGFYLERAGYKGTFLDVLKRKSMDFDFYLEYNLVEKEYSSEWRIFYPKGM